MKTSQSQIAQAVIDGIGKAQDQAEALQPEDLSCTVLTFRLLYSLDHSPQETDNSTWLTN